jgi:hypothetical protein
MKWNNEEGSAIIKVIQLQSQHRQHIAKSLILWRRTIEMVRYADLSPVIETLSRLSFDSVTWLKVVCMPGQLAGTSMAMCSN